MGRLGALLKFAVALLVASPGYATLALLAAPFNPQADVLAWCGDRLARTWLWAAGARLTVSGPGAATLERRQGMVWVGNHQSALDIPVAGAATRGRIRFMAKSSLVWVPFIGWVLWAYRFPFIDRRSARRTLPSLARAQARLRTHPSILVIYPEGTRSADGALLPYKRGAFSFAREAAVPVVPFAILGSGRLLPKGEGFPRPGGGEIRMVLGEPIPPEETARLTPEELLTRCREFTERTLREADPNPPAA